MTPTAIMWTHYCPVERTILDVGNGEPCNWCEAKPTKEATIAEQTELFIANDLPTLTEDHKLNFNPATHPKLKWPAQP